MSAIQRPVRLTMSRYISVSIRSMLWGLAAGRCEFRGCNIDLSHHPQTMEQVNIAEVAHIVGFSEDGPRGEKDISKELARDIENLMLVCLTCHKTIDSNPGGYPIALLREMKHEHEERVAVATAVDASRKSHIVLFGARVGENNSPLSYARVVPALRRDWYPASPSGILLGMLSNSERDSDPGYWANQVSHIRRLVENRIKAEVDAGTITHLSVFAVAPQPLLILLGHLLSDLIPAEVYQLRREPSTWEWDAAEDDNFTFIVERPEAVMGAPALVLGTTDRVADERVHAVLPDATIWRVTLDGPHNDFLKTRSQLRKFRELIRPLIDEIKNTHGASEMIHVFPATSVAIAVEFGRCIQPKAAPPLRIYDNKSASDGFVPTIHIG